MSANFDSGFFVREPAWHGMGTVLADYPGSWDEAAKQAGLDWEPVRQPLYSRELVGMNEDGTPAYEYVEDPDHTRLTRSDNGGKLAIASSTYEIIPNGAMGELVEAILGTDSGVKYNTAGSLYNGKKVWALAEIGDPCRIGKDPSLTQRYIALMNAHDGTAALQALATNVRIVCANTWKAADMDGARSGHSFRFHHKANWRAHLDEARDAIAYGRKQSDEIIAEMEALTTIRVTKRQMELFVTEFVPMPPAQIISDRVVTNIETARQAVRNIMGSATCEGINGTVYGLVQAAGEYLDHVRTYKSRSSYVNRTLLAPEPMKAKAKTLAIAIAKA